MESSNTGKEACISAGSELHQNTNTANDMSENHDNIPNNNTTPDEIPP